MFLHKEFNLGDSIHMASAIAAEVNVLFTYDKGFSIGTRRRGIWIDEPYLPGEPSLFD